MISPLHAETRAVVELFTSQGCSSCPPADKLAASLARDPSTVILSFPVDYWDYLGWKDTLASPTFTRRQKAYGAARGDRRIYTPQAVVNGLEHVVGSNQAAIDAALGATAGRDGALTVPVSITASAAGYQVSLGKSSSSGEVWLLPIITSIDVAIGHGENTGHSVTYVNVVRGIKKIGNYDGQAETMTVARAEAKAQGANGIVILVQHSDGGLPKAVLGAALYVPRQAASQ